MTPEKQTALEALGMRFVPEFISPAEEQDLIPRLFVPTPSIAHSQPGRNRVHRYGSRKPYNNYMVSENIPLYFDTLGDRLVTQNLVVNKPDSVTINEYLKGDIIQAHVDALGGGAVITILSLGNSATMVFRRQELSYTVVLEPRSLIQMRGDLRYKWTHEILPVAHTRYSVVFRCSKECTEEQPTPGK